jgi:predicted dithiol-disulfide oxidoreductase (DUF899 family)/AraC-like DNA-binding protein
MMDRMLGEALKEREHEAAIRRALAYVQRNLDDDLTPSQLARVAGFSQHHFHRIFRTMVGESVMDHVRRLRLERSAYALMRGGDSVASIGLDAGYVAQEAFARIFQVYFGMSPSSFRANGASYVIPAPCGVHFGPRGFSPLRRIYDPEMLDESRVCPVHQEWAGQFEESWGHLVSVLAGLAANMLPPRPIAKEKLMSDITISIDDEIEALEQEVEAAKLRLVEARRRRPKEPVQDYVFKASDGSEVSLSELFGDKEDLIILHNMGTGCVYCTLWADGINGLTPHLSDRAAFVVVSPDKHEVQKRFADKRNWVFRMVSAHENDFTRDMGFWSDSGAYTGPQPGISTFHKEPDGTINRIARTHLGPNDDFCALWPMFDMLEKGVNGWEAEYFYPRKD